MQIKGGYCMKYSFSCIDLPIGKCKTTENVKAFERKDGKMVLSLKTQERSYGGSVIVEKEKTRISTCKNRVCIVKINSVIEDGVEKKITECSVAKYREEDVDIWRRKKIITHGEIIQDYKMHIRHGGEFLSGARERTDRANNAMNENIKARWHSA